MQLGRAGLADDESKVITTFGLLPFYVATPHTTFDWTIRDGLAEIEIEERDPSEVTHMVGRLEDGGLARVALAPAGSAALNPAFDVTPAALIDGFITDRGVCAADEAELAARFA